MQIIQQDGWLSGAFEAHFLISFSSLGQRKSPERSRGKEKAAELLWMLRYNSSTNSYYWVISREVDPDPLPLEGLQVSLRQQLLGWLSMAGILQWCGKLSVTQIISFATRQWGQGTTTRWGWMGRNSHVLVSLAPSNERGDRGDTMRICLQNEQTWRRRAEEPPDEV